MGVSVVFEDGSDDIEVVPGEEVECAVRVENTGRVVDRVLVDVLGEAAEWARVEPAEVNLLPGRSERVRVLLQPPRVSSVAPGEVGFGLRAMSTEDPEGSRIEEGLLRVGEFSELGARLVPKSATGRRSARFRLVVENRGNRPEQVQVEALDPEVKLGFRTRPPAFVARPGTATFVRLRAVPRKTFFRGPNRTLPFGVSVLPESGEAVTAEGVMLEKQTLPEWLLPALAIAAVACGLLLTLWFKVLQPVVHSAASAAAQAQSAADSAQTAAKAKASAKPGSPTALDVKLASPTVVTGRTELATATGTFPGGTGALPKLVWTSSAPSVASVSQSGVVTALTPGTVTITATAATGAGTASSPAQSTSATVALDGPGAAPTAASAAASPAATPVLSGSVTVNVVSPVSVSTAALPEAPAGKAYSQSLTATGGTGSYTWQVSSGSLPPGLTLAPDAGVISGTPTKPGTVSFTVHLADAGPPAEFATKQLQLTVVSAVNVDSSALPQAVQGTPYTYTLSAVGGSGPRNWSLAPGQGALPGGLSLSPAGVLSGTPVETGTFPFAVQVTGSTAPGQSATEHLSLTVVGPFHLGTAALPDAVTGTPYAQTLKLTGGTAPYTWSVPSGLPKGLALDPATGAITGTPQAAGSVTLTILVTDSGQPQLSSTQTLHLRAVTPFTATTSSLQQAVDKKPYTAHLTATGGAAPYAWTLDGTLPAGLKLASDGALTGTPTETGTFPFTVQAADATAPSQSATEHLTLTVVMPLAPGTAALPDAVTGTPYAQTLKATGGTAPYTWSVPSGLPKGLALDPATGAITGTPQAAGSSTLTVDVTDSGQPQLSSSQTLHLGVVPPFAATTSSLQQAVDNQPYTAQLTGTGGTIPYTWTLTGTLPPGLGLAPDGSITGTPSETGTFPFTARAADATSPSQSATEHLTLTVVRPLHVDTLTLPDAVTGTPYAQTLKATGGTAPYTWSIPSGLPKGLTLDRATGTISGTPQATGSSTLTIDITDSGQPQLSAEQTLPLTAVTPFATTTSSLQQATYKQPYSARLTGSGGTAPYTWTLAGTLPPGLDLAPDGSITGTPTETGTFPFTVQVTDATAPPLTAADSLTITVVGSLEISTTSLAQVPTGTPYTQTLRAAGGTAPYTWSWAAAPGSTLPNGLHLDPATGVISGIAATPQSATVTISVSDGGQPRQTATLTTALTVGDPVSFSYGTPSPQIQGQSYTLIPVETPPDAAQQAFDWTVTDGTLPPGLGALDPRTGVISGTVSADPGTYSFTVTAVEDADHTVHAGSRVTLVVVKPLSVPAAYTWTGQVGMPFQQAVRPSGGEGPYTFTFSPAPGGSLSGLSLDFTTGAVSGTPDGPCDPAAPTTGSPSGGTQQTVQSACLPDTLGGQVTVTDSLGETATTQLTVTAAVPTLTVAYPPPGAVTQTAGTPLAFHAAAHVSGGYGSQTYTYSATGLPCDTQDPSRCDTIDPATGVVSGTLSHLGGTTVTFTVTVTSTDPDNSLRTVTAQYQESITTSSGASPSPTSGAHT